MAELGASPPAAMADDERDLWASSRELQSARARARLFALYQPLARRIAWRFHRDNASTPIEPAELLQLASLGLMEAIDRYEPARGVPFRYYCTRRIAGAIVDGLARHSEVNQQISTRRRIERERLRSLRDGAGPPQTLPVTLDAKLALIGDVAAELAIGLMLEDSAMFVADETDPAGTAYETLAWEQELHQLLQALDTLPEREQAILRRHYLEGVPFEQIARLMDLSKGRISQLHKSAIGLLRKRLSGMSHFRLKG